ncbi:hypothetical protein TKK_0010026 [Trichogramma kaykai]
MRLERLRNIKPAMLNKWGQSHALTGRVIMSSPDSRRPVAVGFTIKPCVRGQNHCGGWGGSSRNLKINCRNISKSCKNKTSMGYKMSRQM